MQGYCRDAGREGKRPSQVDSQLSGFSGQGENSASPPGNTAGG